MLSLVFISQQAFCQEKNHFRANKGSRFDWSTIKTDNDHSLIKSFILKNKSEFEWYFLGEDYSPTINDLFGSLHLIDLNGDSKLDVIFDGESGGEPYSIKIFINTNADFEKVLDVQQGIQDLVFNNGCLAEITIIDWGCCAEYISHHYSYTVDFSTKIQPFNLAYTLQSFDKIKWPSHYDLEQTYFHVKNDNYNLRFEPKIDDSTTYEVEFGTLKGNIISKLPKETKGYRLAQKIDETGRAWWFVAIVPNDKIAKCVYYHQKNKSPVYYLGWISSRFLSY